jgi:hypothetical protein
VRTGNGKDDMSDHVCDYQTGTWTKYKLEGEGESESESEGEGEGEGEHQIAFATTKRGQGRCTN